MKSASLANSRLRSQLAIITTWAILFMSIRSGASELTFSLEEKVERSDLVAIVKIIDVQRGKIHTPTDWPGEVQDIRLTASVIQCIKGKAPNTIEIDAYSTLFFKKTEDGDGIMVSGSTIGFSDAERERSYIGYLRKVGDAAYKLGWNSNQFLELISTDGQYVTRVGQTMEVVPFEPKLRKLKSLARKEPDAVEDKIPTLIIGGFTLAIIGIDSLLKSEETVVVDLMVTPGRKSSRIPLRRVAGTRKRFASRGGSATGPNPHGFPYAL